MNPQHCIPTIIDGECTLWESRAILQYFANKYDSAGTLYPSDPALRARVDQKLYFDLNLSGKVREYYFAKYFNFAVADPELFKGLEKQMGFLDVALHDQTFAAGDELTIADFSMISTLTMMEVGKFPVEDYPNVAKWMAMCKETYPGLFTDDEAKDQLREAIEAANATEEAVAEDAAETTAEEGE